MDSIIKKCSEFIVKHKYVVFILFIGLLLMLMPTGKPEEEPVIMQENESILTIEQQLAQILSSVEGAGKVQVMLTQSAGEETLFQTNQDHAITGESSSSRADTIIVTDAQRNEAGLIKQVIPPTYLGAIIVCQGADKPSVRLAIVDAVSRATGLGADRISVLKMK